MADEDVRDRMEQMQQENARLVAEVVALRAELEAYRGRVTTGGPPAPFTEEWRNAPEVVVALPLPTHEQDPVYGVCPDCGHPHPAWISCAKEAELRYLADRAADER